MGQRDHEPLNFLVPQFQKESLCKIFLKTHGFTQAIFVAATWCNFCCTKIASSFKHVGNPCDIAATNRTESRTWFTFAILKLQLRRDKNLHWVAAWKITCVNGPLWKWWNRELTRINHMYLYENEFGLPENELVSLHGRRWRGGKGKNTSARRAWAWEVTPARMPLFSSFCLLIKYAKPT